MDNNYEKQEAQRIEAEKRYEVLKSFGERLNSKRKEAVNASKNSGRECIWKEDEEFIAGIDNANRNQMSSASKLKMDAVNGFGNGGGQSESFSGSTIFANITAPYCANAAARYSDLLMPTDDLPFKIEPTPIPFVKDDIKSEETFTSPDGKPMSVADVAKQILKDSEDKADKAQLEITDPLAECNFNGEVRSVISDMVRLGVGVLKGPFPTQIKARKITHDENGSPKIEIVTQIVPTSKRINPYDFYPDPNCGENIHNGEYVFERSTMTTRQLLALREQKDSEGNPYYLGDQIEKVIKEGNNKRNLESGERSGLNDKFDVWYYYGAVSKEDLEASGCQCDKGSVDVFVVMVNDSIIKAVQQPLDSGEFPYDVMPYQPIPNSYYGIGLARQMRECQRIVTAVVRNLLDNAGIGGSPILVVADGVERDGGGPITFERGLVLRIQPNASISDARQAVVPIVVPMISQELIGILQTAQKLAEDITGLPMLLQGQQGSAPDTVGGMQMLQNNSSASLRNVAKMFDDRVLIPHIRRHYEWFMMYGENDDAKGDFQIVPTGSSAKFEREAASMALQQIMPMVTNLEFGINPRKLFKEFCKSHRLSPDLVSYSDEELEQMKQVAAQQPPPELPQVQVAKIRSQIEMEALKAKAHQDKYLSDVETEQAREDREQAMIIKKIDFEIEKMKLASAQNMSIQEINSQLAMNTQKLTVQSALSQADRHHNQVMTPPTEPVGRAPDGQSFEA